MKIVICGSMKFSTDMLVVKAELELRGHEVTVPKGMEMYLSDNDTVESAELKLQHDYIRYYHNKIFETDAILVLNKTKNDIENYIGGNTLMELGFAHVMHKKIYLLHPIPQMNYSDEIIAVQPIVIHGDLSLL